MGKETMMCTCGHINHDHAKINSHNYTAGKCNHCDCQHFIITSKKRMITGVRRTITLTDACQFAYPYDVNPAHMLGGSNEILGEGSVSGLYLVSIAKEVSFCTGPGEVLCTYEISSKFYEVIRHNEPFFMDIDVEHQEGSDHREVLVRFYTNEPLKTLAEVIFRQKIKI